jgi:hypothetical protein
MEIIMGLNNQCLVIKVSGVFNVNSLCMDKKELQHGQ